MPNIILIQNEYLDRHSLENVLKYVLRSDIVGGYALDPAHAFQQMCFVKRAFHKTEGVQLKHFIIAFTGADLYRMDFDDILKLGFWVGQIFCEYQVAFAVHTDTRHIHLHLVMNTVSFLTGRKYSDGNVGFLRLRGELQRKIPRSDVGLYWSDPRSRCNKYSYTEDDELLRIK